MNDMSDPGERLRAAAIEISSDARSTEVIVEVLGQWAGQLKHGGALLAHCARVLAGEAPAGAGRPPTDDAALLAEVRYWEQHGWLRARAIHRVARSAAADQGISARSVARRLTKKAGK